MAAAEIKMMPDIIIPLQNKEERGCDESATTLLDRALIAVNSPDGIAASTPPEALRKTDLLSCGRGHS